MESGRLTCSAGVAAFPDARARRRGACSRVADGALYWAKDSGRDQTRVFDPDHVTAVAPDEQRAEIEALLADPDLLRPVYQPWIELATGRLAGYEALTRFDAPGPARRPTSGSPARTAAAWASGSRRSPSSARSTPRTGPRARSCRST